MMQQLSNFCVKNPIGQGGGSLVFKVIHRTTGKEYAAKVIEKTKADAKQLQRLRNEVKLHMTLKHKHIVELYHHLEDQDNHYLLLEMCDGDLQQFIKNRPNQKQTQNNIISLTEAEVRHYGQQLLKGLHFLHKQNIIHRDIKLNNILIKNDLLLIADLGLAVQLDDDEELHQTLCGTPNYISPEVLTQKPYGKKADLWSFGCCLYAMKQGRGPFEEPKISLAEILKKVQKGSFTLPEGISSSFKDILINLISTEPSSRYDTEKLLEHPFFIEKLQRTISVQQKVTVPPSDIKSTNQKSRLRENSNSNLRELISLSPFGVTKSTHKQSSSVASLTGSKVLNQFLQQQHNLGSKKILFGMTTIGKQPQQKMFETENLPKFQLNQEVVNNQENDQWLANKIFKKLGLDEISPVKLREIKPCKVQTKNGYFQIGDDGTFQMEFTNMVFHISQDGQTITVKKKDQKQKIFTIDKLPEKLKKFYEYSKQVCSAIRQKSVKHKIENDHGTFVLRQGRVELLFEGTFKGSNIQITNYLKTERVQIIDGIQTIVTDIENQQYSQEIKLLKKYLQECLIEKCKQ